MMRRWLWLSLMLYCPVAALARQRLFESIEPEEGDVDERYSEIMVCLRLSGFVGSLPFVLSFLEQVEWPHWRLNVQLVTSARSDEQTAEWRAKSASLFRRLDNTRIADDDDDVVWQDHCMRKVTRNTHGLLIATDRHVFTDRSLLRRLTLLDGGLAVKAKLAAPFERELEEEEPIADGPLFLKLDHPLAGHLAFNSGNLYGASEDMSPSDVFSESLRQVNQSVLTDQQLSGWTFHDSATSSSVREVSSLLAELTAESEPAPQTTLIPSRHLRLSPPAPSRLGFDTIFVINLERRPERRLYMSRVLSLLGIKWNLWNATDGSKVDADEWTSLPGYLDPYRQRPLTAGEVGCFFSHYRIWQHMVANRLHKVVVFEDDIRFTDGALTRLAETLQDLSETEKPWDLLYLGRKRLQADREKWVPGVRHLSTVGYSYWTLGYALTLRGAEKLLRPEPLRKLMAVDEYLPLMYDAQPNEEWRTAFGERHDLLQTYAIYPEVVVPLRYTSQPGHVSDTEHHSTASSSHDEL